MIEYRVVIQLDSVNIESGRVTSRTESVAPFYIVERGDCHRSSCVMFYVFLIESS